MSHLILSFADATKWLGITLLGKDIGKRKRPYLIDLLADDSTRRHLLPQAETAGALAHVKQLVQDLFGDTRQQYQRSLSTTYDTSVEQAAERRNRRNINVGLVALGLATAGALVAPIFYLPSIGCVLYATRVLYLDAYYVLAREHRIDYRVITAFTVACALLTGFVWAAAFGAIFAQFSRYLVAKTENRSKQSMVDLFGGQVRTVWLFVDDSEVEIPFAQVQVGDIVVVHAGQMMPVDGVITLGTATIDQHMLTGESQPIEKGVGESVLAATIVLTGRVCVRVEQAGATTVAAQITHILSQTTNFKQTLRSRTDRWLDNLLLPIIGLSGLALLWTGLSGALAVLYYYPGYRMIVFGPLSMLSYLQVAAQKGILIKDGRALEVLHEVGTVIFDKTGTLTLEQPIVSQIICCNGLTEMDLLRMAAAAEAKQSHPIARAILQAAAEQGVVTPLLEEAEYKVGYGLKTRMEGHTIRVGSLRFMAMEAITVPQEIATQQAISHAQGHSLVLVAVDHTVAGAIELRPTLRPEAKAIIANLQERGIATVIVSGDHEAPTERLAAELGIDRYFAEVLPTEKAKLVEQLQEEGHKVCFVGDGINDAIALKKANVAISLRGATTIATDTADIVMMDGSLRHLGPLFTLAEEFAANMRVNLLATTLPGLIGIAGTLLLGWGLTLCVFLTNTSTPFGIYNAVRPLRDLRKMPEK